MGTLARGDVLEIGEYAKAVVCCQLCLGKNQMRELLPGDPQSKAIFRDAVKLTKDARNWKANPDGKFKDERGVWYGTDKNGRVDRGYRSNFLEILRLIDSLDADGR